jgi:sterol desaturase/sphingolipid hydroxylase (fatty acid hydroxylase superfamily)
MTDVSVIYLTAGLRYLAAQVHLSLHFYFVDKDNYDNKISQKQIQREKDDYLVAFILHMWAQVALQLMFPGMFFSDNSKIGSCAVATLIAHILVVEPAYYFAHRWLHVPEQMKTMHGFHHMSVSTTPTTSLVQNFQEHFVYIATFGPAMFIPYFTIGHQHWVVTCAYLVLFDIINAFGHTNIRLRHWLFTSKWSPLTYLFYTPEFHLGHHYYYNYNFALFMPMWDHMFSTYKEYKKVDPQQLPKKQLDFVFIGHNGGLGHFLTIPEINFYNIYEKFELGLPLQLDFMIVATIAWTCRFFSSSYKVSKYLIHGKKVGRVVSLLRTPIDYMSKKMYPTLNREIMEVIREHHRENGTRYFGLGNLNKMKQLNDGGEDIVRMVQEDKELAGQKIRIWTGDTLTAASVFAQLKAIPDLKEIFYIGSNGKIGEAVCEMLIKIDVKIRIFSTYTKLNHPNVSYTQDLSEIRKYKFVLIGKQLGPQKYEKVLQKYAGAEHKYLLDYTVPYLSIRCSSPLVHHVQIGVLKVANNSFLRGYYDICFALDQNHIYPCHAGCIINTVKNRETNEVGKIDVGKIEGLWKEAVGYGLANRELLVE